MGGGKTGSMATLATFSSIVGMILASTLPSIVMEGLELASIRKGFNLSSNIKSSPKSSKQYS